MCLPLPPSARDFQIYQRLQLDGASTRQAANDFSLSQTRIRQIVQHVAQWLAQSLPPSCEATDAAWLRLAQHIAADRLQLLYGEAMQGWRATHQPKYAGLILRVTSAMGKMPVTSGALDALLADALEGPLPDATMSREQTCSRSAAEVPVDEQSSTTAGPQTNPSDEPRSNSSFILNPSSFISPPARDCSRAPSLKPTVAIAAAQLTAVTPSSPTLSADLLPAQSAARRAFLAPAHASGCTGILPVQPFGAGLPTPPKPTTAGLPAATEPDASITELKITPQTLGFTTKKPLSRRDRRRRRRLAAKS